MGSTVSASVETVLPLLSSLSAFLSLSILPFFLPSAAVHFIRRTVVIRYHSAYSHHQKNAYEHLLDEKDRRLLPLLRQFQKFDLYSKDNNLMPDVVALRPYYERLVAKFFPSTVSW